MRAAPLVVGAVAGVLAGSGATYLWLGQSAEGRPQHTAELPAPPSSRLAPPSEITEAEAEPGLLPTSDRLTVYAYAAESTQLDELESLIQRADALPFSHRRDFELDALLTRLAELDARRALRFARTLRLETARLVPLFQFWAERDADAALAELRGIENPAARREIALSLLDVLGEDELGIERVAAVLSPAQIPWFRLDAAVRVAGRDPFDAMQRALALDDSATRASVLTRIAVEWVRQDPAAALAQVDAIMDEQPRRAYEAAVLSEWARIDPDGAFAYLRSGVDPGNPSTLAGILAELAPADPHAVLELAEQMPANARRLAQQLAFRAIADRDPHAAIAMIEAMPSNRDREQLFASVGQTYARRDPEGALEWVKAQRPPSMPALMAVVSGIAAVDPDRAVDLMLDTELRAGNSPTIGLTLAVSALASLGDSSRIRTIADRFVERNDPATVNQMATLMSQWVQRDREAAVEWLIGNVERAGRPAVARVATELATDDPIAAAAMMSRLPPELHGDWLQSVAAGYAQYDPEAAAAWIVQYEGRPGYERGVATIAPAIAQTDPRAAARMLERVDARTASRAVSQIASAWAARDPAAAADWATRLTDPAAQSNAVSSVVSTWASQDLDGARRWVLGQPRGTTRDQSLQRLLPTAVARSGELDRRLLDAFSNDSTRQIAVMNSTLQIAARDPDEARRIVDQHVTQPELRQQAFMMIERAGATSALLVH